MRTTSSSTSPASSARPAVQFDPPTVFTTTPNSAVDGLASFGLADGEQVAPEQAEERGGLERDVRLRAEEGGAAGEQLHLYRGELQYYIEADAARAPVPSRTTPGRLWLFELEHAA
ncbi:MAG: hypothetical protein U1E80_11065 [Piscinibacter sp.]